MFSQLSLCMPTVALLLMWHLEQLKPVAFHIKITLFSVLLHLFFPSFFWAHYKIVSALCIPTQSFGVLYFCHVNGDFCEVLLDKGNKIPVYKISSYIYRCCLICQQRFFVILKKNFALLIANLFQRCAKINRLPRKPLCISVVRSWSSWQAHECTGQRCYLDSGRMFGEWEWGGGGPSQCANVANGQEDRVLTLQI